MCSNMRNGIPTILTQYIKKIREKYFRAIGSLDTNNFIKFFKEHPKFGPIRAKSAYLKLKILTIKVDKTLP